jgi:hypothetical protein
MMGMDTVFLRRMSSTLELTLGQAVCLLLVLVGVVGDIVTTGMETTMLGTQEGNPYALAMIEHFGLGGYFVIKAVVVVSATLFLLRLVNRILTRHPKRFGHETLADLTILVSGGGGLVLVAITILNLWVGLATRMSGG